MAEDEERDTMEVALAVTIGILIGLLLIVLLPPYLYP